MTEIERILEHALQLSRDRQWGAAALAFARAAMWAGERGARPQAREAWDAAGEHWRRDDRPRPALRALRMALDLADDAVGAALARVKLAALLGELGSFEEAVALCHEALEDATSGPLRWIVLDTTIQSLQALGRKEDVRPLVQALEEECEGRFATAGHFRRGQLLRMDGDLDSAAHRFAYVVEQMADDPQAQGGVAAAEAELGEVALLRGDHEDAIGFFERAFSRQQDESRRGPMWRAEAARVRAMVDVGVQPLVGRLDEGLSLARERELPVLELDLRLARGMALAETDPRTAAADLDRATAIAEASAMPLRAGRARYERAVRVTDAPDVALRLLEQATEDLTANEPLRNRARLALARALYDTEPDRARSLAVAALARFQAMGMRHDAEAAARLVPR